MHASKAYDLRSLRAARYCPKVGTATKQPAMSHELQGTSRSLLLEGQARLNTIKHPNQLVAFRCAAAPTPRSQPQCALHALRRARLRSSDPWTARSSQLKAASDGDDVKLRGTLFSPSGRVRHQATVLRHGASMSAIAARGAGQLFKVVAHLFTKSKASPWGPQGELHPNRA
jgi:hypothetical protein